MVAAPAATPVTWPVDEFTAAIPELLLVHTPPDDVSVKLILAPTHTVVGPLIVPAFAAGLTLIVVVVVPVPHDVVTV